jgi:phage anti-repressor protein
MNELIIIPIEDDKDFPVSAKDLYEFLGITLRFNDWINNAITDYDFKEDEDYRFSPIFRENSKGGRPLKDYYVSLEMAKEIAMVAKSEKGRQVRRYFIQKEKELRLAKDHIRALELANANLEKEKAITAQKQLQIECSDLRKLNRHMELDIASVKSIGKIQSKLVDDMYKELRRVENRDARRKS